MRMETVSLASSLRPFEGMYRITTLHAKPAWIPRSVWLRLYHMGLLKAWEKRKSDWISNHVVFNTTGGGHGVYLILRALVGDNTYPIEIDNASIGDGSQTIDDTTTDLNSPVVEDILRADYTLNATNISTEWYIIDTELPDGTYTEFALKCGTQTFAVSAISPSHTKGTAEDTLIEYIIHAGNGYTPA